MTSAMTAANVSDSGTVYRFTVEDWPKDRAFYLARFRLPAIILGGLLVVLAAAAGLFSCAYHPLMAVRGTMLFLPGA